jgi:predicted O-methyltransferase YrrM
MNKHLKRIEELWAICPELKNVMVGNELVGRSGKIQKSQGASTPNNLLVIANIIYDLKVQNSLETGMAFAASTLAFLAAKRDAGIDTGKHIAIDPFQKLYSDDGGVMAVERAKLADRIEVRYSFSSIELPRQLEAGASFDLIYVDGSHLFEDAFIDAYFAIRLLRNGGIVLFDDSADRHVAKVVKFLRTNLTENLCELDLSRWRGDFGRNWRYRAGRMFGHVQLTGFQKTGDVQRKYGTPLVRF